MGVILADPTWKDRAMTSTAGRLALGTLALGAACVAYGAGYEVRSYRLRRVEVPVLAPGAPALRVLQLSDLHLTPGQTRKIEWVRRLSALQPDLVITTGDNLSHPDAVGPLTEALGPLLERPGGFVFGSNDYYAPHFKNPARYLDGPSQIGGTPEPDLPVDELRAALSAHGWADLNNARRTVKADGRTIELVGVDDPHIDRDDYASVAGAAANDADLSLGVVHAPYRRVLDAMAADRLPLILAGHTHGGQLCVPFLGALVTNCDLPVAQAKGLSRHRDGRGLAPWLHVSAGLGTSPYAPIRFACPPEATLLTLVARNI
jgi:uncharacterized protein